MFTPLTAEAFAVRLVCSACSVVRLPVVAELCCAWAETRLVAKSDKVSPAALKGALRLPDAPRPAVAKGRFAAVADAPARAAMLEKGQADLAFDLDPASLSRLRGRKGIAVIGTAALGPRLLVTAPGTLRPARLAWSDAGSAL